MNKQTKAYAKAGLSTSVIKGARVPRLHGEKVMGEALTTMPNPKGKGHHASGSPVLKARKKE